MKSSNNQRYGGTFVDDNCGASSKAFEFDGLNDYVECKGISTTFPKILNSFSVAFWIKSNTKNPSNFQSIASTVNSSSSGFVFGIWLFRDLNGKVNPNAIECSIRSSDNKYYTLHLENDKLNDGKWHHVAFVVDDLSKSAGKAYFDASLSIEEPGHPKQNPTKFNDLDYPLVIGASNNRGKIDKYFNGSLDEFVIYSKAISSCDVNGLFLSKCGLSNNSIFIQTNFDNTVIDSMKSSNNQRYGGTFVDDNCGSSSKAFEFDGLNDYVECKGISTTFPKILNSFSVAFWIKSNTKNPSNFQSIASTINNNSSGFVFGIWLFRDLNGKVNPNAIECSIRSSDNKYYTLHLENDKLNDGKWHHVAFVVDDLSKSAGRAYFDASLSIEEPGHPKQNPTKFNDLDYPLVIGASNNRGKIDKYLNGSLDEFVIYSKAISSCEIEHAFQVHCGSTSTLSETRIESNTDNELFVWPNPILINSSGKLHFSQPVTSFLLINSIGQVSHQWTGIVPSKSVVIPKLPRGTYFLKTYGFNGNLQIKKLLIN
jgi:hypothetical protein